MEAQGFHFQQRRGRAEDVEIDFVATKDQPKEVWAIECQWRAKDRVTMSDLRGRIDKLVAVSKFLPADHLLLAVSTAFTAAQLGLARQVPNLTLWDIETIRRLLVQDPALAERIAKEIEQKRKQGTLVVNAAPINQRGIDLANKLKSIPPGNEHWREYEDVCIEILTHLFRPHLGVPPVQSRSEDGLDRRDAIYPILRGSPFWQEIRSEFNSRMVVAEFKNYSDEIGQAEVESIQQYLFMKAMRLFGILCSRKPATENGLKARRRAWTEHGKMIVLLTDADLLEMLDMKALGEDPTTLLDQHIDAFLTELAP